MRRYIAPLLICVSLTGCTVRVADLTLVSTKNVNINDGELVKGKRVVVEDKYPVIIIPFGIPSVKTAADKAIEQDNCAVGLTDVVVTQLNHAFIIGETGVRVEGNLLIDRHLPGCSGK